MAALCAVLLLAAAIGVLLIVQGSRTAPPPPAPSPDRPFSIASPGSDVPAGEVIPPPTGPVTRSAAQTAAGSTQRSASIADGDARHPPVHQGPWTFDGPNRLFIQSLDVEAPIEPVGSDGNGLIVPTDVKQVGRWTGGAELDGDEGTVLIAGHVNYADQGPGALYNLANIEAGAVIVTNDASGTRSAWRVVGLESVNKKALPGDIFTKEGARRLVLVTCGGDLLHIDGPDGGYNTYENNVIVRAVPA